MHTIWMAPSLRKHRPPENWFVLAIFQVIYDTDWQNCWWGYGDVIDDNLVCKQDSDSPKDDDGFYPCTAASNNSSEKFPGLTGGNSRFKFC